MQKISTAVLPWKFLSMAHAPRSSFIHSLSGFFCCNLGTQPQKETDIFFGMYSTLWCSPPPRSSPNIHRFTHLAMIIWSSWKWENILKGKNLANITKWLSHIIYANIYSACDKIFVKQNDSVYLTLKSDLHELKHEKGCVINKHLYKSSLLPIYVINNTHKISLWVFLSWRSRNKSD